MSTSYQSSGHSGPEIHHYYRQGSAPVTSDPLQIGDIWSDTAANLLKRCTSLSPVTFVSVEGGSSAHDLFSATHGDVDEVDSPNDGELLEYDGGAGKWKAEAASSHGSHGGEANTASNVGVSGVGIFKQKSGTDLELKKINAGSGKVSVTDDVANDEVDVDVVESGISHANIGGKTSDDHHTENHAARHADGGADELAVQDMASDAATDGQVAKADGAGAVAFEDDEAGFSFIIDGGGSAITTGIKGDVEMPFAGEITSTRMFADQTGSIQVDIWKDTYANFPPTDADSITASAVPTITSAVKSEDATLTGWTKSFSKGDVLRFNVDSASTVQRCTVSLNVKKT